MKNGLSIDLSELIEAVGGVESTAAELIGFFFQQTDEEMQKLNQAIADQDAGKTAAAAHKCAGSSISCGLVDLAREFKELEMAAKAGVPDDALRRMNSLRDTYQSARSACSIRFNRDFNS